MILPKFPQKCMKLKKFGSLENCMKMKEFGPGGGGGVPGAPLRSANAFDPPMTLSIDQIYDPLRSSESEKCQRKMINVNTKDQFLFRLRSVP